MSDRTDETRQLRGRHGAQFFGDKPLIKLVERLRLN
jgi:hypothetical protein